MKLVEPPSGSRATSTVVFIGRNGRGNWIAREQNGLFGGLFINRAQAFKYAQLENGHHPETIVEVSRQIELIARRLFIAPLCRAIASYLDFLWLGQHIMRIGFVRRPQWPQRS
jgi:hypothetical protein